MYKVKFLQLKLLHQTDEQTITDAEEAIEAHLNKGWKVVSLSYSPYYVIVLLSKKRTLRERLFP